MANLTVSKVFVGRLVQVIISDSSDAEKINWSNLKPESVTVSDELKESLKKVKKLVDEAFEKYCSEKETTNKLLYGIITKY